MPRLPRFKENPFTRRIKLQCFPNCKDVHCRNKEHRHITHLLMQLHTRSGSCNAYEDRVTASCPHMHCLIIVDRMKYKKTYTLTQTIIGMGKKPTLYSILNLFLIIILLNFDFHSDNTLSFLISFLISRLPCNLSPQSSASQLTALSLHIIIIIILVHVQA